MCGRARECEVDEYECSVHAVPLPKKYEKMWDDYYNVRNVLMCVEQKFRVYRQQSHHRNFTENMLYATRQKLMTKFT